MLKTEHRVLSTNRIHHLHVLLWEPDDAPIGIVQINHGMCDYIERYDEFAEFLAKKGYVVVGHDHIGHGLTVHPGEELGYFYAEHAENVLVDDMYEITKWAKNKFPDLSLVIQGHSMGSIALRKYIMKYGHHVKAALIMSTSYTSSKENKLNLMLLNLLATFKGKHSKSSLLKRYVDYQHNKQFIKENMPNAWLTRDMEEVIRNTHDPLTNFTLSINGYLTILKLQNFIENKENIKKIPTTLPVLLVAGTKDTLNHNGQSIEPIKQAYLEAGLERVDTLLIPEGRHDLLHEINRVEIFDQLYQWIKSV